MENKDYGDKHLEDASRSLPSDSRHTPSENEQFLQSWSHEEQKKLIRRVDVRLIPVCGVMYCVSLLDRTNLSNAVIAGMGKELMLANVDGVDRYVWISLSKPEKPLDY